MTYPSIFMVSGFLGAGKTTLATGLINHLWSVDINAALITNDQSSGLVDSEIALSGGVEVKEISGGCFCCRCDQFALALDEIIALRQADIIIAEAVGSCTDLVATVVEPLRVDLRKSHEVLPITAVIDPLRAEAVLMGRNEAGRTILHDDVTYIFLKQLEEAQVILINKSDSLPPERMGRIVSATSARFPEAKVMAFSARDPKQVERFWQDLKNTKPQHRPIQEIDYSRYAKGEGMLGWLNAECLMESAGGIAMSSVSDALAAEIHRRQAGAGVEIAHLKVSLTDASTAQAGGATALSVVQCVTSADAPVTVKRCNEPAYTGRVLINLRAQGEPTLLDQQVRQGVAEVAAKLGIGLKIVRLDAFAPSAPNPPYQRR